MSQKNETTILILALLITGGLLGAGYWWFTRSQSPLMTTSPVSTSPVQDSSRVLISQGEQSLFSDSSPEKQAGLTAFSARNFETAITNFEASLQNNPNDPETLIYLNNARIGNQNAQTIAVAVPGGNLSNIAQEILRGVAQAQNQVNQAGGINGVPLKVIIADDQNNSDIAQKLAEELVKNNNILGVLGHFSSGVSLAVAPIYNQGQLVMISPTSTSVRLSTAGNYVFRTVPSDRFAGNRLAQYFRQQLNRQKAVIFYNSQSEYSQSLKDEFTTALYGEGGEVVNVFDLSDSNFNAFRNMDAASQQGAEAIVLFPDSDVFEKALQVVRVNRRQLPILAGDHVYQLETLKVGGDSQELIVAVPWHILASDSAFPQEATRLWRGDVNWRTAMAYDATQALITALQQQPSRTGVQQALAASSFSTEGATGTIKFLPSGDRNQAVQLIQVQPGNRSGVGYDFVPLP